MHIPTRLLLLGLLLLLLIAPFAAFAPLLLIMFVSVLSLIGWTLLRTLLMGDPDKRDPLTTID